MPQSIDFLITVLNFENESNIFEYIIDCVVAEEIINNMQWIYINHPYAFWRIMQQCT